MALRGSQASPGNNCLNRLHIKLSLVCPLGLPDRLIAAQLPERFCQFDAAVVACSYCCPNCCSNILHARRSLKRSQTSEVLDRSLP